MFPLVYPLYFSEIIIWYLKFSSLIQQQESQIIYVSYHTIIEHYHSNHLIPISAL